MKLSFVFLLIFSATSFAKNSSVKVFTVMSYNLENLFDTRHDAGKEDYTYLPLKFKQSSQEVQNYCASLSNDYFRQSCFETDWNEIVLKNKIENLGQVISSFDNGKGPDILLLQEVENKSVLKSLVEQGLKGKGYKYFSLLEGPDSRGIDVGIISRFPIVKEKLHLVDLEGISKETRGILQADIRIGKKLFTVFSNHWPSQSNPSEARLVAAQTLLRAALESHADGVFASGDFNTIPADNPHGINLVLKERFYLARAEATARGYSVFPGSHWYRGHWGALDKMFILKGGKEEIVPLYSTFGVYQRKWMLKKRLWTDYETGEVTTHYVPKPFDLKTGKGFADHLPLTMSFIY